MPWTFVVCIAKLRIGTTTIDPPATAFRATSTYPFSASLPLVAPSLLASFASEICSSAFALSAAASRSSCRRFSSSSSISLRLFAPRRFAAFASPNLPICSSSRVSAVLPFLPSSSVTYEHIGKLPAKLHIRMPLNACAPDASSSPSSASSVIGSSRHRVAHRLFLLVALPRCSSLRLVFSLLSHPALHSSALPSSSATSPSTPRPDKNKRVQRFEQKHRRRQCRADERPQNREFATSRYLCFCLSAHPCLLS